MSFKSHQTHIQNHPKTQTIHKNNTNTIHNNTQKSKPISELSQQREPTNLFLHIPLPSRESGREKPRQPIELGGLDAGRPNLRVFVAEKHMAIVAIDRPPQWALPEFRPKEPELRSVSDAIEAAEKPLVLEAPGGASDLRIRIRVEKEAVSVNWGRRRWVHE